MIIRLLKQKKGDSAHGKIPRNTLTKPVYCPTISGAKEPRIPNNSSFSAVGTA